MAFTATEAHPSWPVSYEPNSLGGGCPFQAGARGFTSFPQPIADDKVRGKPEKFAEHYNQATLFWNSQTPVEKAHIVRGFRFELTKVQTPAIRERTIALLANVDATLASSVAEGLGIDVPQALPRAVESPAKPEVTSSTALSLFARPGEPSVRTRHVAILVADGTDGAAALAVHRRLSDQGAVPRMVGARLGSVATAEGDELEVEITFETSPSVLYDAVVIPGGDEAAATLSKLGQAVEFVKDQYRHCKPIMAMAEGTTLLANAGIPSALPSGEPDPGVLTFPDGATDKSVL